MASFVTPGKAHHHGCASTSYGHALFPANAVLLKHYEVDGWTPQSAAFVRLAKGRLHKYCRPHRRHMSPLCSDTRSSAHPPCTRIDRTPHIRCTLPLHTGSSVLQPPEPGKPQSRSSCLTPWTGQGEGRPARNRYRPCPRRSMAERGQLQAESRSPPRTARRPTTM